jgi:hypothetical protein
LKLKKLTGNLITSSVWKSQYESKIKKARRLLLFDELKD